MKESVAFCEHCEVWNAVFDFLRHRLLLTIIDYVFWCLWFFVNLNKFIYMYLDSKPSHYKQLVNIKQVMLQFVSNYAELKAE